MRSIILYIAASIDSYIAKSDGDVDWLHNPDYALPNEDYGYADFYAGIDSTLMGNKTYEEILKMDVPFPYPDKTNYVFSRSGKRADTKHVQFISEDPAGFVRKLKEKPGEDIWLIGGGQINSLMLQAGLIDRIILTIMPVLLGEGIPLTTGAFPMTHFQLKGSEVYSSGLVQLHYQKKDD